MRRPQLPAWARPRWQRRAPVARPERVGSMRVLGACYAIMAVVTIVATGVGFWLSYAGLHSFAVRAGLAGAEAWAWPSSVDLFILAGELGITVSTLRDQRHDWRAWVYFGMGCGPSVTFNIVHVFPVLPWWCKYAVAATPPIAALLALAALMQQVTRLPEALAAWRERNAQTPPGTVLSVVPNTAESAALASLRATTSAGNPLSQNQLMTNFGLSRVQVTKVRDLLAAESNGHAP